ncbi:hypothetical protein [Pseudoalteromonas sp. T1lg76]|uniref:hypothetical protein n=1 Tax=Pseudoalteromonas sp. T1lg76 TaxID=2077103 RepID=UPI00131A200C|nr:hypothetical protein [Pseudoalteromonas sp. T1lg76]
MPLWIKLSLPLALLCLSGCASYVADEITSLKAPSIPGNLDELTQSKSICDEQGHCVGVFTLAPSTTATSTSLKYVVKVNENHKVWRYVRKKNEYGTQKSPANEVAIIFPGYGQPSEILAIMAEWLYLESGADVLIIESAEKSEHFQFGLDSVSPIISMINREQPKNVKLIGFSMGAVAAHAVAQHVENAELHLVAPMTNFEQSALGVWNVLARDSYYRFFVSQETLKEAVGLVHQRAQLSPQDIDITRAATNSATPAHIYISSSDTVTPAQNWQGIKSKAWRLHEYPGLNHMEMVTLLQNDLFLTFAAHLLGKEPDASDIATFGLMCDADDEACMSQEL